MTEKNQPPSANEPSTDAMPEPSELDQLLAPEVIETDEATPSPSAAAASDAIQLDDSALLSPWESPPRCIMRVCRAPNRLLATADIPSEPYGADLASMIGVIDDLGPSLAILRRALADDASALAAVAAYTVEHFARSIDADALNVLKQVYTGVESVASLQERSAARDALASAVLKTLIEVASGLVEARTKLEANYVSLGGPRLAASLALNSSLVPGVPGAPAYAVRSTKDLLIALTNPLWARAGAFHLGPDDAVTLRMATDDVSASFAAEDDRVGISILARSRLHRKAEGDRTVVRVIHRLVSPETASLAGQALAVIYDAIPDVGNFVDTRSETDLPDGAASA